MTERVTTLSIESVNVGKAALLTTWSNGEEVYSGIDKRPLPPGELVLSALGLAGDVQADTRTTQAGFQVHGGPDQAVYAFPAEHYPRISELVGTEVWPGYMGENLTVRGATEGDVYIGDIWTWGAAHLQISSPRGPCYKMGLRMGKQALRTALRREGLVGWYMRVPTPGTVHTSASLQLLHSDPLRVTVGEVHRAIQDRHNTYRDLAAHPLLAPKLRAALLVRGRDLYGGIPERD